MGMIYTALTVVNIILVLVLLYYFYQSYREVKSRFALGLMVFALIFLVNAVLRCPLTLSIFTADHNICPYTPYYTIAAGFEFLALLVLIYLVRE